MSRAGKVLAWSGGVLALLVLLVLGLVCWLLFSTAGARWTASEVTRRFAPQVKYARIDGTLAGRLIVDDFRFEGDEYTARVRIAQLSIDPTLRMLFSRVLRIDRATVRGLVLTLPEKEKPDEPDQPLWIQPPLDVVVNDFSLVDGRVLRSGKRLVNLRQLGVAARWTRDALIIERLRLLSGDIEGDLDATGRITPAGQTVRAQLRARWNKVVIPEKLAGMRLASNGTLEMDGTPARYTARGRLDLGPPGDPSRIALDVSGTDKALRIETLDLVQRAGRLSLQGSVNFDPAVSWSLSAHARGFDPGAFLADWHGSVDLEFATRGEMAQQGPSGRVNITRLAGTLRGRPLSGEGDLEFAAPARLAGLIELRSGRSRVALRGASGTRQQIDATVDLGIDSLNDWVPHTAGSLTGRFVARGVWPKLTIEGAADGRNLGLLPAEGDKSGGARVRNLHVAARVDSPLDPNGTLQLTARDIDAGGLQFESLRVGGSGNAAKHGATLDAQGDKFTASLAVAGGLTKSGGWSGELSRLELDAPELAQLTLRAPARLAFEAGAFSISQACLADQASSLCLAANVAPSGALDASYSFEQVPLALANALAPTALPGQLRGEVAGSGHIRRADDGQWFGNARLASPSARIVLLDEATRQSALGQHTLLIYENLVLEANLAGTRADARLKAALDHGGRVDGTVEISDLTAASPALRGDLSASVPTLAPFAAFLPSVGNLDGALQAKLELGGTLQAPAISGNLEGTRLQADLGQLGIQLREGEARAEALRAGGFTLSGHVKSGKGQVALQGTMTDRGAVELRIRGDDFLAADIPAAKVVVAPDLTLTGAPAAYLLKGDVAIPSASINLQKMPRKDPPGASPDVVVVRDGKVVESAAQQQLPLTAAINVKLGEQIAVTGYGLDARVTGELLVRESPGTPTSGSGQLSVSGKYQAYGQDLTIKDGRLLFAGSPLDNPRLAIVATREISQDLSTGLRIAGSAQRPLVTVISDPEVGEADALSYLVTGRSLNEIGSASGSSQDALASATHSVEGAAGGLIAKRIGKRLGLDEAGVEENEMIGGSALTIGEYLSPRLYLSYGVGLFQPGEVIALRYKLSHDVGVKVQRGTEETRAGVEYRIER